MRRGETMTQRRGSRMAVPYDSPWSGMLNRQRGDVLEEHLAAKYSYKDTPDEIVWDSDEKREE